ACARPPPRSPLFPYTTLFRSAVPGLLECRLAMGAAPGEFGEARCDGIQTDVGRIEEAAIPGHDAVVLRMFWVGHGVEKLFKAREAAHIFWRSPTGAVDKAGVVDHRVCSYGLLDHDTMAPVVAKIIGVGEAGLSAGEDRAETDVAGVAHLVTPVGIGIAIAAVADLELEEMIVLKQHGGLDDGVNCLESAGQGHLDPSPDGGLHIVELNPEPGNTIAGHAVFLIWCWAAQFHGSRSSS